MMRKNNNMRHRGGRSGGRSGGGRGYQDRGGHGGGRGNEQQNLARQKHHAMQQREKYTNMARDAQINGDRSDVEYYLQHVDHYTRVLTDIHAIEAERYAQQREQQIVPGGPNDPNANHSGGDGQSGDGNNGGNHGGDHDMGADDVQQQSGNQPRMTRQHQPRNEGNAQQASGNQQQQGSGSSEIPLPGSVLTAL